jgi:hypothetical protein
VYITPISLYNTPVCRRDGAVFDRGRGSIHIIFFLRSHPLGKPNFNFQKRQKELAKKKKSEEKKQRKLDKNAIKPAEDQTAGAEGGDVNREESD